MRNAATSETLERLWKKEFRPPAGTPLCSKTVDHLLFHRQDKDLDRATHIVVYNDEFREALESLLDCYDNEPWIELAREIVDACLALSHSPEAGILCPDIAPDCYELRVGDYLIYYHCQQGNQEDPLAAGRVTLVTFRCE